MDSRYNTLLIVEGEECEKSFFNQFAKLSNKNDNILIVPFCNDIYELYKEIKDLEYTTTKNVLLSHHTLNLENRKLLTETKFVYTYLVFDLDLQNSPECQYDEELKKVKEMLELFDDETGDYGKLFINYPMMESYRHFYLSDTNSLRNKEVKASKKAMTEYCSVVNDEGTTKNVANYKLSDFVAVAKAHLCQANLLMNGVYKKPDRNCYEELIEIKNINQKQSNLIINEKRMFVLNTSTFIYVEYYPQFLNCKN